MQIDWYAKLAYKACQKFSHLIFSSSCLLPSYYSRNEVIVFRGSLALLTILSEPRVCWDNLSGSCSNCPWVNTYSAWHDQSHSWLCTSIYSVMCFCCCFSLRWMTSLELFISYATFTDDAARNMLFFIFVVIMLIYQSIASQWFSDTYLSLSYDESVMYIYVLQWVSHMCIVPLSHYELWACMSLIASRSVVELMNCLAIWGSSSSCVSLVAGLTDWPIVIIYGPVCLTRWPIVIIYDSLTDLL